MRNQKRLSGPKAAALSRLRELADECGEDGWDGADALPISPAAYRNAADLIRVWPADLPLPDFAPEPDGSVSFDWIASRHRLFLISVGDTDRLAQRDGSGSRCRAVRRDHDPLQNDL